MDFGFRISDFHDAESLLQNLKRWDSSDSTGGLISNPPLETNSKSEFRNSEEVSDGANGPVGQTCRDHFRAGGPQIAFGDGIRYTERAHSGARSCLNSGRRILNDQTFASQQWELSINSPFIV